MNPWKVRAIFRLFGRRTTVPIENCVHFGAFRYGRSEPHPYETYAYHLVAKESRDQARAWFIEFLRHYRPRDFAEAIGTQTDAPHPLWSFPWTKRQPAASGWFDDPLDYPDIVTQFCTEGILWFRIEQEFFWLERAVYSIRRFGYRPAEGGGITAQKFVRDDGVESFLILDGNHRLSALSALGHTTVDLTYLPASVVFERRIARWPMVKCGRYSIADARRVLHAYFDGNPRFRTTTTPASLLELPGKPIPA